MGTSLFVIEILLIGVLLIAAIAVVAVAGTGFARPLAAPVETLPSVTLPQQPRAEDVARVRFSLGLRGYRADQVDEVLDRLARQLAHQEAEIDQLREAQQTPATAPSPSTVTAAPRNPE
ncbi:MAG: DivIVA domain-containing protein [Micrococcaceae bacterium]